MTIDEAIDEVAEEFAVDAELIRAMIRLEQASVHLEKRRGMKSALLDLITSAAIGIHNEF